MVQIRFLLASLAATVAAVPLTTPVEQNGDSLAPSSGSYIGARDNGKWHGHGHGGGWGTPPPSTNAKAVYFITNAAKNSVVALKVHADGTLSDGSITLTGGAGLSGTAFGAPSEPDSLFSQGALKVTGNSLITVNPGSNTLSMFNIDPADPTKLTLVGKQVNTLGEFPVSLTVSEKLGQVCVVNGGAKAGISCFAFCPEKGLTALDTSLRTFEIGQVTPADGPPNTISQVFFNADSTALLTTVKGNPFINSTGFLSVFPVVNGRVSTKDVRSSPAGTSLLFGVALIPNSDNIFMTDAAFGSATIAIGSDNKGTVVAKTTIAGQFATCWATISPITNTAFVTDVGVNSLVEIDPTTGKQVSYLALTNGNSGMLDLVSAGNFIYSLSPGNMTAPAVTVFDVSGGAGTAKQIQNFLPKGVTASAQGMGFF